MVGQIGNDRFDIFIGDGRIPGGDHASHQVIPIASISAGPLGDVFPEATGVVTGGAVQGDQRLTLVDRKSTRLNSSHVVISYAVFCLNKKK